MALQGGLSALAGTDLPAHLSFQRSATHYHDAMRAFYYPFLCGWQLLLGAASMAALGLAWLRTRPVSPL